MNNSSLYLQTCLKIVLAVLVFGLPGLTWAEEPDPLERGWEEYRFLGLDMARNYFSQVVNNDPDPLRVREATMGLAMVAQFAERGRNLDLALELYEQILPEEDDPERNALIRSFLADLHWSRGENEEALAYLNELIEQELDTVIGQDALLRRLIWTMGPYGAESSVNVARETEKLIEKIEASPERPLLVPMLSKTVGLNFFWASMYEDAVRNLERFVTIGTAESTNYSSQASELYRLGSIYEHRLNDPERAGRAFRRLAVEYTNSPMAYFALEKAIEFGAISRHEVEELNIRGLTVELLDELFAGTPSQGVE